jgi:hypothetical protein
MRQLEKFIEALIKNRVLRSSQIFYDFLTIENLKEFKNIKANYSKCSGPTYIKDYMNCDGIIEIKITPEEDIKAQKIIHQVEVNENALRRLTKSFDGLTHDMQQISLRFKEISDIFEELAQNAAQEETSQDENQVLKKLNMMMDLTDAWGESYTKQIEMVDLDLREFFHYIRKEMTAFKDNIADYNFARSEYVSAHIKLFNKKEELFKSGNVQKWEIPQEVMEIIDTEELKKNKEVAFTKMLSKDTQQVNSMRRNFGYQLNALVSEYSRLQKNYNKRYKNHFLHLSNKNTVLLGDVFNLVKLLTCNS